MAGQLIMTWNSMLHYALSMDLEVTSNGNTGSIIVEEEVEEEMVSSNNNEVVHNEDEQVLHSDDNSNEDVAEQAEDDPGVVEVPEQESGQQDMVRNKCPRCGKKFKDFKALGLTAESCPLPNPCIGCYPEAHRSYDK